MKTLKDKKSISERQKLEAFNQHEDRENILCARASGKGVLTSPFKLLKSNNLGVVLTFAVCNNGLPRDAIAEQGIEATMGYYMSNSLFYNLYLLMVFLAFLKRKRYILMCSYCY